MVLNVLNFSILSQFFIVRLFYSNHIFLPTCALTLKFQMVFFLPVLFTYVFHDWKIKHKSGGNTRNGNLHKKI